MSLIYSLCRSDLPEKPSPVSYKGYLSCGSLLSDTHEKQSSVSIKMKNPRESDVVLLASNPSYLGSLHGRI